MVCDFKVLCKCPNEYQILFVDSRGKAYLIEYKTEWKGCALRVKSFVLNLVYDVFQSQKIQDFASKKHPNVFSRVNSGDSNQKIQNQQNSRVKSESIEAGLRKLKIECISFVEVEVEVEQKSDSRIFVIKMYSESTKKMNLLVLIECNSIKKYILIPLELVHFTDIYSSFHIFDYKRSKEEDISLYFCLYSSFLILLLSYDLEKQSFTILSKIEKDFKKLRIQFWENRGLFLIQHKSFLEIWDSQMKMLLYSISTQDIINNFLLCKAHSMILIFDSKRYL